MNHHLKQAYTLGAQKALRDFGITKEAEDMVPEGRGLSRFGHTALGALVGAIPGLAYAAIRGGSGRHPLALSTRVAAPIISLLGAGSGALTGWDLSRQGDSVLDRLRRLGSPTL